MVFEFNSIVGSCESHGTLEWVTVSCVLGFFFLHLVIRSGSDIFLGGSTNICIQLWGRTFLQRVVTIEELSPPRHAGLWSCLRTGMEIDGFGLQFQEEGNENSQLEPAVHAVKLNTNMCTSGTDVTPSWVCVVSKFHALFVSCKTRWPVAFCFIFLSPDRLMDGNRFHSKQSGQTAAIIKALYNIYAVGIKPMKSTVAFVCTENRGHSAFQIIPQTLNLAPICWVIAQEEEMSSNQSFHIEN